MIKINLRGDPAGEWLEGSVRHLVSQAGSARPGRSVLLAKMAEALFIETIRRYMEALPPEQTGWLAGARDPVVGGALALLHRKPQHHWTVDAACRRDRRFALGSCREVLPFSGEPPLTYLARWRLQLAARMLQTTREAVIQVALRGRARFRKRRSIARSSASSAFRQDNSGDRPPDRTWLEATGQLAFPQGPREGIQKRYPVGNLWRDRRSAGSGLPVDQAPSRLSGSASGKGCCDPLLFGAMRSQRLV